MSSKRSQQTPSAKGRKGKIQRLDRVSCPDMEIQVLSILGIAMDGVSCPDTDIRVSTTRFPEVSCFEKPTRSVLQCTCAKKVISSNFAKIMHNYVQKKNAQLSASVSGHETRSKGSLSLCQDMKPEPG
jgi:hypothetical protein